MSCWMSQRRSCPNERGKRVASGSFRRIAPPGPAPFFSFSFFASNLSFSGEIFASFVSIETPFSVVGGIETLSRSTTPPVTPLGATQADLDAVEAIVRSAGTSFYRGMRVLPPDRRHAMYAIYAFCRVVDHLAGRPP